MLTRRSFVGLLAGLPIIGGLIKPKSDDIKIKFKCDAKQATSQITKVIGCHSNAAATLKADRVLDLVAINKRRNGTTWDYVISCR
jgi:hypothetical protein